MGKSQFFMGKSPGFMGKSPFLMGKSQFLMGHVLFGPFSIANDVFLCRAPGREFDSRGFCPGSQAKMSEKDSKDRLFQGDGSLVD